jgi:putative transposase
MNLAIPMTTSELCRLAEVSRAGFYRWKAQVPSADPDMELRDEIQRIALEFTYYGSRRVTRELHERGWLVNRKKVQRLMREDNLLCLRKRRFIVTTDSNHALPVYPNLAREMVLTGLDQLWRSDITYVRLETEFVYLAVVLDAFSRKVVGWALDRTLEATLTIEALQMALRTRKPAAGLVHHSDRGVQYASGDYTDLLKAHGIQISMSRRGNPYDNAQCESFMKTLKYEEVYRNEYRDLAEARAQIGAFLDKVYNQKRLHSALGYLPPTKFEAQLTTKKHGGGCAAAGRMSFLRHQRSFRPMGKVQTGSRLGAHSRLSSARMSRSRLFLGGSVSTGARFRFTGCGQNAVQWSCRSSNLQRTANSVLFGCLSQGVHPTVDRMSTDDSGELARISHER